MNCLDFESRLEALLDGTVGAEARQDCLVHAEKCFVCGELLAAVVGSNPSTPDESTAHLTRTVLERTIGSACSQAKEQLPAYVDQELTGTDKELLDVHLEGCVDCQKLASTLVALRRDLPSLAEAPVDEQFVSQVLAATLPRHTPLQLWWRSHWSGWVQRPRFAMEAAYVGLLVVILVLGAFSTPVAALTEKGIGLVQPDPQSPSVWTHTQEGLGTFWERVASLFEKAESEPESTEDKP